MRVFFDVQHLYYLPQFLPVQAELARRGVETLFLFHEALDDAEALAAVLASQSLPHRVVDSKRSAIRIYQQERPDWIIFGNGCDYLASLPEETRTALIYHGIGVKECYYDAELMEMDIRFVEGEHRYRELKGRYPEAHMLDVGFAKLDPLLGTDYPGMDLARVGLDPGRKTILYAPTFYPSSIELQPADLPQQLSDCNLLIKPHHFTFTKRRYSHQLEKLQGWASNDNVWLAGLGDVSLLPMMGAADLLLSEASSALFEFAALDKPIVWCDFYWRRWSHRGPLRKRLDRRLDPTIHRYRDIARHAATPDEVVPAIRAELADTAGFEGKRRDYTNALIGPTDGKTARRIADALENAAT
ncbi:MAG: CDP-glycerol glycerophosphotransferase family protein [Gammaproteobacteria bacterium]|nr:CDP-glycerol glycerophosphotransferase family protein [Gammaproteobacteria bacterium]